METKNQRLITIALPALLALLTLHFLPINAREEFLSDDKLIPISPLCRSDDSQKKENTERLALENCLSCHDGAAALNDAIPGPLADGVHSSGAKKINSDNSHPVGMDYYSAMKSRPGQYNNPASTPDIRLEGNRVTCLSCHKNSTALQAKRPGALTALCMTCHRL
ncbi:MAG: hypothetical protein AAB091_01660 [Elusimicrobiota bacterium]